MHPGIFRLQNAVGKDKYFTLSHAIEITANQKARNLLHILRYATGSIPRKNPGIPHGLQICQNFHSEIITVSK